MTDDQGHALGREYVQSLVRGIAVIRAFDGENPRMTLTQVAQRTGMTRATARRFLITLQALGYVGSDERQFYLRSKVLNLGRAYLASLGLPSIADEQLKALSGETGESCSASVIERRHIVYIARFESTRPGVPPIKVGTRVSALSAAMGVVHLAELAPQELEELLEVDEFANSATVREHRAELVENVWRARIQGWIATPDADGTNQTIAVPVRNCEGHVVAAIDMSTPAGILPPEAAHRLTQTAKAIGAGLRQLG